MIKIYSRKGQYLYPTDFLEKAGEEFADIEWELYCEDECAPNKPHWALDNYRLGGQSICPHASHIFYTQPSLGEDFSRLYGRDNVQLVTYGIDPEIHKPHKAEKKYDVGFIGNVNDNDGRKPYLDLINKHFNCFISTSTPTEEIPLRLSECKVLFNHIRYEEVNIRFFEAMAVGVQVCTHTPALSLFADLGRDFLTFKNEKECVNKIQYLLDNDRLREEMEHNAQKTAKRHTYRSRLLTMLHFCNAL